MKVLNLLLCLMLLGCQKQEQKPKLTTSPLEKVAIAHGIEQWDEVTSIDFTFNMDKDTTHFERSWTWYPKTNKVILQQEGRTLEFQRKQLQGTQQQEADTNFTNDLFWLLAPFKLIWDTQLNPEPLVDDIAPISQDSLKRLTIVYESQGGYRPGDAYDLYIDENYQIKEWTYREENTSEVCMNTTWEDYKDFNGIKLATMHQNDNGVFRLYFTNININKNNNL